MIGWSIMTMLSSVRVLFQTEQQQQLGESSSKQKPTPPLYVFLAFDKVGSTSMRDWMKALSADGETNPCNTWTDGIEKCRNLPGGSFVNEGAMYGFDFCEKLVLDRPCQYFTILRDPIQRILSSYKYFCVECQENGRQCIGGSEALYRKVLRCPNMTIVEYARALGSPYTRSFANHGTKKIPFDFPLTQEHLKKAFDFAQNHIVVLGLEKLQVGEQTLNLLRHPHTAKGKEFPRSNANSFGYNIDDETLIQLEQILDYDIILYEMLGLTMHPRNRTSTKM